MKKNMKKRLNIRKAKVNKEKVNTIRNSGKKKKKRKGENC